MNFSIDRINFARAAVWLTVLAVAATALTAADASASTNKEAVKKGAKYLTKAPLSSFTYGFKADAIQALSAARKAGSGTKASQMTRFIDGLADDAPNYAVTAGAAGKAMLGAVTGRKNPRCFGGANGKVDLVGITNSFYANGRYGDTAYDHAFAILGLVAAHQRVPAAAIKFAKQRRGKRGWGFGLSSGSGDDVQSTALMIEALRAAGVKRSDKALQSAYKWMRFQRNMDGGYNHEGAAAETNANATAMAIRAADALGKKNSDAKRALRALQQKNGVFRISPSAEATSKVLSTADAVIALAGRHYPLVKRKKAGKSCV